MKTKQTCEHEINIKDEYWLSDNQVEITCNCNRCNTDFKGVLKMEESK